MIAKRILFCTAVLFLLLMAFEATANTLTDEEQLGKNLFFDTDLSDPAGQSCADCHAPEVGFTGPDSAMNALGSVYEGAMAGRFGNRKPPSAAYGGNSPVLYQDDGTWTGGMFWDGRATGEALEYFAPDPLAEQALGPFLNPLEQNLPNRQAVIDIVVSSAYNDLFDEICIEGDICEDKVGEEAINCSYECIGVAIAAYENSSDVSPYTSKYDKNLSGDYDFTPEEAEGKSLFEGKAKCGDCHVPPDFTDFTYDNIGIPRNLLNPFYYEPEWNTEGILWTDHGLGGFLMKEGYPASVYKSELGKFKVPTLRNVGKGSCEEDPLNPDCIIKAYGHNGYFKSLKGIVHFYNTRDTLPTCNPVMYPIIVSADYDVKCWPEPEERKNMNRAELGNLRLTDEEEDAIVAFLMTLSDEP